MSRAIYTDDELKRVAGIKDEIFKDQVQLILEIVTDMQAKITQLPTRQEFNELKQDTKVIKAAVTDTSRQVHDHERRITRLEAAT
jgi:hypothetical protein